MVDHMNIEIVSPEQTQELQTELEWSLMNVSYNSFKVKCKEKFLKWGQGIKKFNKI